MAKQEYKRERKKITDGLRLKRLKEQIDNFDPEEFSGCLTLGLCTMVDVQNCRLEVNHTFPNKEILVLRVAEEANLRGINFVCTRSDLRDFKCTGPRFCVIARHSSVKDGLSLLPTFMNVMSLEETSWTWTLYRRSLLRLFGQSGLYH